MSSRASHPPHGCRAPSVHTGIGGQHNDLRIIPEDTGQPLDIAESATDDPLSSTSSAQQESVVIKEEDSDSEFLWAKMQEHNIELASAAPDSEDENIISDVKKKPKQWNYSYNDNGDEVLEIVDSDDEGFIVPLKQEPADMSFDWSNMPSEPIVLSDVEDETVALVDGLTSQIKQEHPEGGFLWSEIGNDGTVELLDSDEEDINKQQSDSTPVQAHPPLERSNARTRRLTFDPEKIRQLQQLYTARALEGKRRSSAGAGGIFSVPRPSHVIRNDFDAWMHFAPKDNSDVTSNFAEIKRQYKAKKKAKTDTIEDEILFKKAQDAERARLRKLEAKMYQMNSSDEDDEEAEQSEDGLFIPDSNPPISTSKRRNAGSRGEDSDDERPPRKDSRSKRQKNSEKPLRTKAELRSELYHNLMAGYEEEAAKDQKKAEHEAMQADKAAKREDRKKAKNLNSKHTHELMKGKKPGKSKTKPNIKSKRKPMTIRNLKTTDIYKESNANLAKLSMPSMTGKEKRKAMTDLIASIPLEESKIAKATSDRAKILKATIILSNCKVNGNRAEGEGDWNLKGLTTPLFHHQVLGAARMKERECGEKLPQGGILADEMGHGKTLSAIAAMISNQPAATEQQRCTLIICSPAIINQWDEEIKKHTKPGVLGGIFRHHGITRLSSKGASGRDAVSMIEKTGVVLSTYSEVITSYPKCDIPEHLTEPVEKMTWWKKEWETERGLLHRVQFYRVILDESQVIKNHRSFTSIACRALMAKHRWAISGTPIQNSIEEIYPYFKFLRIPYTGSFRIFKHNFCDPENEACFKRLHSYLDSMMIRRTHQDEILGTAIVKLPKAHHETKYLAFNKIEERIYVKIRKKFIKLINVALADGSRTDDDRCRIVLTMVLRLRQMTSHLFMLQETMEGMLEVEDIDDYSSAIAEESGPRDPNCLKMLAALKKMLQAKDDEVVKENDVEMTKKAKGEPDIIYNFRKLLRTLKGKNKLAEFRDRSSCHRCKLPPEEPMLTSCSHLYCAECLKAMSYEASEMDEDHSRCLKCNEAFTGSTPCPGLKELEPINISPSLPQANSPEKPQLITDNKPERPKRSVIDNMKWVIMDDDVVLSTKTAAVVQQVEQWLENFPTQKIIIFSQFHLVFQILGKACEKKSWKYCHYHGKMSHKAREEAVEKFRDNEDMKIMIASLKCGGIGLNLTMASRVICVDLWFNSSVEQQAFCRVLRIGQKQETHITRFIVNNTIDERLVQLQRFKDQIISAAMDGRTVLSQLTLKELLSLFGEVGRDANSQPFIYAEDDMEKCWGPLKEREIVADDEEPQEDDPLEEAS